MGRVHEIAALINNGENLLEIQISTQLTIPSILDYLRRACGYGFITRADVYYSIPRRYRALFYCYEQYHNQPLYKHLKMLSEGDSNSEVLSQEVNPVDDVAKAISGIFNVSICEIPFSNWNSELYKAYREFSDESSLRSDLYNDIAKLEKKFNVFIREILISHFGKSEEGWWRRGIKKELRAELMGSREMDDDPAEDAFCYLSFIHIKDILKSNWGIFSLYFGKDAVRDKNKFLDSLTRVNAIRNQVMHPIKNAKFTYSDFELVHSWLRTLDLAEMQLVEIRKSK